MINLFPMQILITLAQSKIIGTIDLETIVAVIKQMGTYNVYLQKSKELTIISLSSSGLVLLVGESRTKGMIDARHDAGIRQHLFIRKGESNDSLTVCLHFISN